MITIELDETRLRSGTACRGRTRLRFDEPLRAERVVASLVASQTIRTLFSSEPPTRQIYYSAAQELAGRGELAERTLGFELRVPGADELAVFPRPPAFLLRLVHWLAPNAIQPLRWELEVRLERRLRADVVATAPLEVELGGELRRAG